MSQNSRAALKSEQTSNWPDNDIGYITPSRLRSPVSNIVDSSPNIVDDGLTIVIPTVEAMKEFDYSIVPDGASITLRGYHVPLDGGGGNAPLQVDKSDTTTPDDGFMCFVAADGTRIKRPATGVANILEAGAVADWDGTTGTDNKDAVDVAAAYARTVGAELIIPENILRYRISGQIDLREIPRIRCSVAGFLVDAAFAGVAVRMGGNTTAGVAYDLEISVTRESADWTDGNIGVEINRLVYFDVRIHRIDGFARGLYLNGTASLHSGKINHGTYLRNKVDVWVRSASTGFSTETIHNGGYFWNDAQVGGVDKRVPILLEADGQVVSEHKFYSPVFEMKTGVMIFEALFTQNNRITNNLIKDCRIEGVNSPTATKLIKISGTATYDNVVEIYINHITSAMAANAVIDVPANTACAVGLHVRESRNTFRQLNYSSVLSGPKFHYKIKSNEGGVLGLNCMSLATHKFVNTSDAIQAAHGDGMGVHKLSTSFYGVRCQKRVGWPAVLASRQHVGEFAVICWDANGAQLSGTAPYYVNGSRVQEVDAGGGVMHYRINGDFIYIHPNVFSFFIGPIGRNVPALYGSDMALEATWAVGLRCGSGAAMPAASEYPKMSYWPLGAMVLDTANSVTGWKATSRVDTRVRVAAAASDTTLEVDSTTGMLAGDVIGVELDSDIVSVEGGYREMHWTTIASITDGDTLVLTAGIPALKSAAIGRNVYTNRWATAA